MAMKRINAAYPSTDPRHFPMGGSYAAWAGYNYRHAKHYWTRAKRHYKKGDNERAIHWEKRALSSLRLAVSFRKYIPESLRKESHAELLREIENHIRGDNLAMPNPA